MSMAGEVKVAARERKAGCGEPDHLLARVGEPLLEPGALDLRHVLPLNVMAQTPQVFEFAIGSPRNKTKRLNLIFDHRFERLLGAKGPGIELGRGGLSGM